MDEFKLDKLIDFQCYISKENKKKKLKNRKISLKNKWIL